MIAFFALDDKVLSSVTPDRLSVESNEMSTYLKLELVGVSETIFDGRFEVGVGTVVGLALTTGATDTKCGPLVVGIKLGFIELCATKGIDVGMMLGGKEGGGEGVMSGGSVLYMGDDT
jgi:hypothetical protein